MATLLNVTRIPAPRVPLIDERTGEMSREWYRFFENLFILTGGGGNPTSLSDVQKGPPPASLDELQALVQRKTDNVSPSQDGLLAQIAELQKQIHALESAPSLGVELVIDYISSLSSAPILKTADFSVGVGEKWFINNKSGSTCTVTLPSAAGNAGRQLTFQNYQNQFLVSASSNVVPRAGGSAGTAILDDVAGNWATLVSNGTNWVIMQAAPYNVLLI